MERIKELFKRIWDWIKGAGRKIVAVVASILSLLFIGKIFSNKKSKRDILKKEIKDLKKEIKDEAKEVTAGYECGMSILKFNDIKEGDIFECFVMEEIKQ